MKDILKLCALFLMPFHLCLGSQDQKMKEILKFCQNNGHKYISILNPEGSFLKQYSLILKSNYTTRGQFVKMENLDRDTSNWDFLISEKYTNVNFSDILKIMNTRKIQKSMLVINENEVQEFKVISKIVLYFINDKKNFL